MHDDRTHGEDTGREVTPEDDRAETGSESNSSSADVRAPFAPHKDDDSPLGDTDQHSTA